VNSVTFEYEKGINIEQVEQLKAMEKNLIGMAREVEKLRAEVLNAEKRAALGNFSWLYI
jgi:short-subunit dehydrogenase